MFGNDYIMNMIQQMVIFIARIMKLKESGQYELGLETVDEAFREVLGLNPLLVDVLSHQDLMNFVNEREKDNAAGNQLLADLLVYKSDLYKLQNKLSESSYLRIKALNVYLEIILAEDNQVQEWISKAEAQIAILKDNRLPIETKILLFQYYHRNHQFSVAEDILFEILKEEKHYEDYLNMGIKFYQELLENEDRVLEEGNLPRDEILEGLVELNNRM